MFVVPLSGHPEQFLEIDGLALGLRAFRLVFWGHPSTPLTTMAFPTAPWRVRDLRLRCGRLAPCRPKNTARIGATLSTYRLTTRNNAMMAAWFVVIE
jgi:hypothetical protein